MWRAAAEKRWRRLSSSLLVVSFFATFYLYALFRIVPHLLYLQDSRVFLLRREFFLRFLDRPGGLVRYLSAFFSALLAVDWLGALVLTLLAAVVCLGTWRMLRLAAGSPNPLFWLIPAVFLAALLGQYVHLVEFAVGLAVALGLASIYFVFGGRTPVVRLAAFVILSVLAYSLAAGLYLVFACLCGAYELGCRRHLPLGLLGLCCGPLVPLAGAYWFDLSFRDACGGLMTFYRHWLPPPSTVPLALGIRAGLLLFFPLVVAVLGWKRGCMAGSAGDVDTGNEEQHADMGRGSRNLIRCLWPWATAFLLMLVADVALFNHTTKCLLQIVSSAESRRWPDVLAWFERLPPADARIPDVRVTFHLNCALYHLGLLPERMFRYPHVVGEPTLLLTGETITSMALTTPCECSAVLFDLGRINEAEHMAHEALEQFGERPTILKLLVYINVIKGRPGAARKFLAVLESSLLYRSWARRIERQLDRDPALAGVPEVVSARGRMVRRDTIDALRDPEGLLGALLERDPGNRMAFEYLMAHYLLTKQLDKLAAHLHRLDDLHYPHMPTLYEEALLMYLAASGQEAAAVRQWKVREQTKQRFARFVRLLRRFPKEQAEKAYRALYDEFGDSYFLFCVFGNNYRPLD